MPLCQSVNKKWTDFTYLEPLRVAVGKKKVIKEKYCLTCILGTYNINGGKHFRSVVYKNVSLDDWLLDAHKDKKEGETKFRYHQLQLEQLFPSPC